ncbi:MAG: endonuclease/exonuclease/phosphatase family protein [Myxococcales bacterium]
MRVVAGKGTTRPERKPAVTLNAPFAHFRAEFRKKHGDVAWREFRKVSRSMFGEGAFTKVRGEEGTRLTLTRGELEVFANNPARVQRHLERLQAEGAVRADGPAFSAAEAAAGYAKLARAAFEKTKKVAITVATVNDDFTDRKTNLPKVKASVMLVQEAKNTNVRRAMSDKWGVHQNVKADDKAGTAVVWDRKKVDAKERGYTLAVKPNGAKMLNRWVNWTDVVVDGVKVRMMSVHRPPPRYKHLWPRFDAQLAAFVRSYKGPIVVGLDANQRDPRGLERATGLKWHAPKGSIDGFLASPGIEVDRIRRLPKGTSDHHPVVARFTLRDGKR